MTMKNNGIYNIKEAMNLKTLQYKEILKAMNLNEKISQLSMANSRDFLNNGEFSREKADAILENGSIGAILDPKLPAQKM